MKFPIICIICKGDSLQKKKDYEIIIIKKNVTHKPGIGPWVFLILKSGYSKFHSCLCMYMCVHVSRTILESETFEFVWGFMITRILCSHQAPADWHFYISFHFLHIKNLGDNCLFLSYRFRRNRSHHLFITLISQL